MLYILYSTFLCSDNTIILLFAQDSRYALGNLYYLLKRNMINEDVVRLLCALLYT